MSLSTVAVESRRRSVRGGEPAPIWVGLEPLESRELLSATVLHDFVAGQSVDSIFHTGLIAAGDKLYGTLNESNFSNSKGILFSIDKDGTDFTVLHTFGGTLPGGDADGKQPRGQLALVDGKLYGTTHLGGDSGIKSGVIFSIDLDGSDYAVIHEFDTLVGGFQPAGGLLAVGDKLYGTTVAGGSAPSPGGTVFSIDTDGTDFTLLHTFNILAGEGVAPLGGLTHDNGVLYGTTSAGPSSQPGGIFAIDTDGSDFRMLHLLNSNGSEGRSPSNRPAVLDGRVYAGTVSVTSGTTFATSTLVSVALDGTDFRVEKELNLFGSGGPIFGDLTVADGRVYGTSNSGGPGSILTFGSVGTLFAFEPGAGGAGFYTAYAFRGELGGAFGTQPLGDLAFDGTKLYTMTQAGGLNGKGTLVALDPSDPATGPAAVSVFEKRTHIISGSQATLTDYGTTPVKDPAQSRTFIITNTGAQPLTFGTITTPNGYSASGLVTNTLPPGESISIIVSLSSQNAGTFQGNITINHNGANPKPFLIPVKGIIGSGGGGDPGGSGGDQQPDLTGEIREILLGKAALGGENKAIPGDKVTATLRVFNAGIGILNAQKAVIKVFASTDLFLDGNDIPLATLTVNLPKIVGGKFVDLKLPVTLPKDMPAGSFRFLADIDSAGVVAESDDDNNLARSALIPVALAAGNVGARKNVKLTVQDGDGSLVTFALTGLGTVNVTPVNGGESYDVQVTGGNSKSALTVTSKGGDGQVTLRNVTLGDAGAGHGTLTAKTANLAGTLSAPGGLLNLTLRDTNGATIDIDAFAGAANAAVTLAFQQMFDTLVQSDLAIKKFTAVQWADNDLTRDKLEAPAITALATTGSKPLAIPGDFQADVSGLGGAATVLGGAKIAGSLNGAAWNLTGATGALAVTGNVGTTNAPAAITAAAIKSLTVNGSVQALSINLTQAFNPANVKQSSLTAFTVKGTVEALTLNSAGNVGAIKTGAMTGSDVFIGVEPDVLGLPDELADFTSKPGASLTSLTVTGGFTDSNVAATTIGAVTLPPPATDNADVPFGIAATAVKTAKIGLVKGVDADKNGSVDPLALDDFVIRIV